MTVSILVKSKLQAKQLLSSQQRAITTGTWPHFAGRDEEGNRFSSTSAIQPSARSPTKNHDTPVLTTTAFSYKAGKDKSYPGGKQHAEHKLRAHPGVSN